MTRNTELPTELIKPKQVVELIFQAHQEIFGAPMHPAEYSIQTLTADRKRGMIDYQPNTKLYALKDVRCLARDFIAAVADGYENDDYWSATDRDGLRGPEIQAVDPADVVNKEAREKIRLYGLDLPPLRPYFDWSAALAQPAETGEAL